jgi:hypothetical protein
MDGISVTGQGRGRFLICQVSSEGLQTAQAFQVEALTICLMQEVNVEVGDHSSRGMERYETFQIGSGRDPYRRLRRLLRH